MADKPEKLTKENLPQDPAAVSIELAERKEYKRHLQNQVQAYWDEISSVGDDVEYLTIIGKEQMGMEISERDEQVKKDYENKNFKK